MANFIGHGLTIEDAFNAALEAAKAQVKPVADNLVFIKLNSVTTYYGGLVEMPGGCIKSVEVTVTPHAPAGGAAAALLPTENAHLVLSLQVIPDTVYANLMPPLRRPQPHKIGLILTVANIGGAPYVGQSQNNAVTTFYILQGRTTIWEYPKIVMPVVTPVRIEPGQSLSYAATWEMSDAVDFVGADLHAVARFTPSGDSAIHAITVKPAF